MPILKEYDHYYIHIGLNAFGYYYVVGVKKAMHRLHSQGSFDFAIDAERAALAYLAGMVMPLESCEPPDYTGYFEALELP